MSNYVSEKICPSCGSKMSTDGKEYWCACGVTIARVKKVKKPKKISHRTAHDIREEQ
jgi:tRNA(Ile2) C34 agmatinyltransferase TiaS